MAKEYWEYLSIGLEVISFFLITTDLYGEEKLKLLRDKLGALKIKNGGQAIFDFIFHNNKLIAINLILFIVALGSIYYSAYILSVRYTIWENHYILRHVCIGLISIVVTYLVLYVFYILLFISIGYLYDWMKFLVKLVQLKPLKYIMLPLGTALFILSKLITIIAVI